MAEEGHLPLPGEQEFLDVVDVNDAVIGRETRARIHRKGLMHRSSHVMLNDSRGRFMVQLRSRRKDIGGGLWDSSAAGHVDSGESYRACAVRELQEELGVDMNADALREIGRLRPEQRNGFEFTRVYRVQSDQPLVLQVEEIDDARWLDPHELSRWIAQEPDAFTQVFRVIWHLLERSIHDHGVTSSGYGSATS